MKVFYLDWFSENEGPHKHFSNFHSIGKSLGIDFEWLHWPKSQEEGKETITKRDEYIDNADAFIAYNTLSLIAQDNQAKEKLYARINSGAPLLVLINNSTKDLLDIYNDFLKPYEIIGTDIKIAHLNSPTGDERLVSLKKENNCFHDLELFSDVTEVLIQQPDTIWYGGDTIHLLTATEEQISVTSGDLICNWNARQPACMVGRNVPNGELVIAISGNVIGDPYTGALGHEFPGITKNGMLAKNLLGYLKSKTKNPSEEKVLSGDEYCDRIEINMADFVLGVLRNNSSNWWVKYVPKGIRTECAKRQEEEDNQILQKEAYLCFIDLKSIIDKNWTLFDPHFQKIEKGMRKADAIDWINTINTKYRRMSGHPLKRHISKFEYTEDDIGFLREKDELSRKLNRQIEETNDNAR